MSSSSIPYHQHDHHHEVYNSFKFYTPKAVWLMCVFSSFLMFFDQGTTFANVNVIREDPVINAIEDDDDLVPIMSNSTNTNKLQSALSTTASGIFSCIFMLGFVVGTPLAAANLGKFGSNTLLKFGTIGWVLSVLAVSCAPNYYALVVFRFCVGFFEGFFSPFLVTIIDNIATKKDKMMWLAVFYAMMPVMSALGMFVSSQISSHVKIETDLVTIPGWRVAYFIEIPLGIALAVMMLGLPKEYNIYKNAAPEEEEDEEKEEQTEEDNDSDHAQDQSKASLAMPTEVSTTLNRTEPQFNNDRETEQEHDNKNDHHQDTFIGFGTALHELICNNTDYLLLALGYSAFDFLVTSFGSWAVVLLVQGPYDCTIREASAAVGVPMAICGVIGTIFGGKAIDLLGGIDSPNGLSKCVGLPLVAITIGFPLGIGACLTQTLRDFLILFVPCVIFVTMNTAGIGIAYLNVCQKNLRAYATSMMLLMMNGLGDLPAPLFVGILSKTFFNGECASAGTEEHCNLLRDIERNETAVKKERGELSYIESTWWWRGECKWNVASLKDQESYCANTSQINRALLCAVFLCFVAVPCWGAVVYRKWGTSLKTGEMKLKNNRKERRDDENDDERTKLLD